MLRMAEPAETAVADVVAVSPALVSPVQVSLLTGAAVPATQCIISASRTVFAITSYVIITLCSFLL